MNERSHEEQRLADLLKRTVPEPPRQLTYEEITMRHLDRSMKSWLMPAMAAATILVIGGAIGAVAATRPDSAAPRATASAPGTSPAAPPTPKPTSTACEGAPTPSPTPSLRMVGGWVTVPDVTGLRLASAEQVVQKAGLLVSVVFAPAHGAPAGTVLSQRPAQGTRAGRYTPERLTVAAQAGSPQSAPTPVPSTTAPAVPSTAPTPVPSTTAAPVPSPTCSAAPKPAPKPVPSAPSGAPTATPVPTGKPGGAPTATPVPKGPARATVPDVLGMTEAQAVTILQQAGFNVKVVSAPEPSGHARGTVFRQSPGAGAIEAQGAVITIYG